MDFEKRQMTFDEADRRYVELKQQCEAGIISDEEFDAKLKDMMIQGSIWWWAKSRSTGEWHYYDGESWVKGAPPREQGGPEEPAQKPEAASFRKPSVEELLSTCTKYDGPRFYVGNQIPRPQLNHCARRFPIPSGERVVALLDCRSFWGRSGMVLGGSGIGLAVCEEGIRWRSPRGDGTVGYLVGYLEWSEFATVHIEVVEGKSTNRYRLLMGESNVFIAEDGFMNRNKLLQVLTEIQSLLMASLTE
jgi:hypothetical protein